MVFVGSYGNGLFALDAMTGEQLWTACPGNIFWSSSPAIANGIVYVTSYGKKLYAFDSKSGKELWNVDPGMVNSGSPIVAD